MTTQADAHCWACHYPNRTGGPVWNRANVMDAYELAVETIERMAHPFNVGDVVHAGRDRGDYLNWGLTRHAVQDMARHGLLTCHQPTRDGLRCWKWTHT